MYTETTESPQDARLFRNGRTTKPCGFPAILATLDEDFPDIEDPPILDS